MSEKAIIITNNILSLNAYNNKLQVDFIEGSLLDVLICVRDYIHKGHILLTHPLMGSIKPNQTPYKTVAISFKFENKVDIDSLMFIENSIESTKKLLSNSPLRDWKDSILEDFRVIDFDLINNAIKK